MSGRTHLVLSTPAYAGVQVGDQASPSPTFAQLDPGVRRGGVLVMVVASLAATPAAAQSDRAHYVQPYVEVAQAVAADLSNDDVTTYTSLAAGVDAGVNTARSQAQISYRYERRFDWADDQVTQDVHSGLARAAVTVAPGLNLEAGGIATRARTDIRGAAPGNLVGDVANVSQVYSLYAGPSLATRAGPLNVGASYFVGFTKVETPDVPGPVPVQRLDYFDTSTSHLAQGSVGTAAGEVFPFAIQLSGAYEREDASQLDQTYEGWFGRGDVTLPLSGHVAIRGGVGYERIKATQRDPLVDATGAPLLDGNGRYVTDPASPERIAYDTDGLIYDAGVIWRPSPRLELQASAGWRYGGETYFGSLSYAIDRNVGLAIVAYDGVETFGRQLRDGLRELPTAFEARPDPFGQQFAGCVFGARPGTGGAGAGGCLNDVFQSIATASYRARGIDAVLSASYGRTRFGIGGGYANRRFNAPRSGTGGGVPGIVTYGLEDQSAYAQAFYGRDLSRISAIDLTVFGSWYSSGLANGLGAGGDVYGGGANATYSLQLGRLGTLASIGLYGFDQEGFDTQWSAQALLGARYTF